MTTLSNKEYKFVCELLWGGPPVDRVWAEGTKLFEIQAPLILAKYPMLDKSFFEDESIGKNINKSVIPMSSLVVGNINSQDIKDFADIEAEFNRVMNNLKNEKQ